VSFGVKFCSSRIFSLSILSIFLSSDETTKLVNITSAANRFPGPVPISWWVQSFYSKIRNRKSIFVLFFINAIATTHQQQQQSRIVRK
jgi:hypothetical protein